MQDIFADRARIRPKVEVDQSDHDIDVPTIRPRVIKNVDLWASSRGIDIIDQQLIGISFDLEYI